jgi:1-phosphatidylinositol-3-phosphate 5-kinase
LTNRSPIEHVFPDSPIIVREDEPSTIIAYTLSCDDYLEKLREIRETYNENFGMEDLAMQGIIDEIDNKSVHSYTSDGIGIDNSDMGFNNIGDMYIERTLRSETGTHVKYHFSDRITKFFCKIFFSEQFDALRKNCGCDESYLASLASCIKWDSSGGKSGSAFLKTKDDRLLMKQMSRPEMDAFLKFAPAYFQYLSEALFHGVSTKYLSKCLACFGQENVLYCRN